MREMLHSIESKKKLELRISVTQNLPKNRLLGKFAKKSSKKTYKCVTSLKTLSRPLMFLSVATGLLGESGTSKGTLGAYRNELDTRHVDDEVVINVDVEDWLVKLYAELKKQGIAIPERLNEDELFRFYDVSNGDFAKFISSVKKTIQWRRKYTLLSPQELESWDDLVFWHGCDVMQRPSLVIRFGLACANLDSDDQAQFARAIISQVEHGVVNLLDEEITQLTVLMDCDRLPAPPFKFPLRTFRSCVALLQDHYPDRLGCLLAVRVPRSAQVMTETLIQEMKPRTPEKVRIVKGEYKKILSDYFEELPHFPLRRLEMNQKNIENGAIDILAVGLLLIPCVVFLIMYFNLL